MCPFQRRLLRFGRDMIIAVWRGLGHAFGYDDYDDYFPDDPLLRT